ncbi:unnamed protein product, partial [Musa acuminata subsp. malaccensis]
ETTHSLEEEGIKTRSRGFLVVKVAHCFLNHSNVYEDEL